ncbi:MAG: AgmX/PglI C-terminal domain-containing protein [Deltaproteobacteria bacterium]|nr:AgmX/PglI C-terminal domain-containing protein [Deltaproteobacteria bacterium]
MIVLGLLCALGAAPAADAAFDARFVLLQKSLSALETVRPRKKEERAAPKEGPVLVSNDRQLFLPESLGVEDISKIVRDNRADLAFCYESALEKEPSLEVKLIVDLSVKRNGRVAELSISPTRELQSVLGSCLMSRIPRWKFPEFSGEVSEGVTQEVVNLAVPLSFAP